MASCIPSSSSSHWFSAIGFNRGRFERARALRQSHPHLARISPDLAGKPWLTAVGGNGGFSLRSKSKTLECLAAHAFVRGQWCELPHISRMQRSQHVISPPSRGPHRLQSHLASPARMQSRSEDVYYVDAMRKCNGRLADRDTALAFSVESVHAKNSFAFHAACAARPATPFHDPPSPCHALPRIRRPPAPSRAI